MKGTGNLVTEVLRLSFTYTPTQTKHVNMAAKEH